MGRGTRATKVARAVSEDEFEVRSWEARTSNRCLVFDNFIGRGKRAQCAKGSDFARAKDTAGQATKGIWWMPWYQPAKKDVASCEKPRGAAKQALIRGCPNGETRSREMRDHP